MLTNDYVRNGFLAWDDYDRSFMFRSQFVVTQRWAQYLTNILAILIALTMASLFIICVRGVIKILSWCSPARPRDQDEGTTRTRSANFAAILDTVNNESDPLKAIQKLWKALRPIQLEVDDEVDNIQTSIKKSFGHITSTMRAIWNDRRHGFATCLVILFSLGIFVGVYYASVVSAKIASGSVVLSDSPDAGLWELDLSSRGALLGEGPRIAYEKQQRAWKYRANCYDKDMDGSPDCNIFYRQRIKYKAESNTTCPFDGDVCALGPTSAFKVDTGLTDSNVLGVNAPAEKRFWFQHSLTCAPLIANETYVKSEGQEVYPGMWEYYYGVYLSDGVVKENQTFYNTGDWNLVGDWMPDYSLSFVFSDPTSGFGTFDPLPEFKAGSKTVTVIFLSTGGPHLHLFKRDDPIFPARTPVQQKVHGGVSTFWKNNSTRAGVLGCVDWYQVCTDSIGSQCWDMVNAEDALEHFQNDVVRQQALYLVLVGLNDSNTWHSINYLRANILNATAEIAQIEGIRLAKEQWKVEVENIFKGTLAYIQLRVFDFARGTYAHFPDVVNHTDPRVRGIDAGRMYKFRNGKYINVSTLGFWGGIALCIVLYIGSFRFSDEERAKRAEDRGDKGYHNSLWIFIMFDSTFRLIFWPIKKLWAWARKSSNVGTNADSGTAGSRSLEMDEEGGGYEEDQVNSRQEEESRGLEEGNGRLEGANGKP